MDNVTIKLKVGAVEIPSNPVFGDDVKLKFSREENQVFLRSKIDGKIKFVGADFDFIASCSHDTTFTIEVYRGSTLFGSGTFLKSDCSLNYDDKVCSVKLTVTDRYEKFLANYDNKYNLVKLAPQTSALTLTKRGVLQIYVLGDKKITNYYGNVSFEAETQNDAESKGGYTLEQLGFTNVANYVVLDVNITQAGLSYLNGRYYGEVKGTTYKLWREDRQYYIGYTNIFNYADTFFDADGNRVIPASNQSIAVEYSTTAAYYQPNITLFDINYEQIIGKSDNYGRSVYARALTDYATISGWSDVPKAISGLTDDIAQDTYNYNYVVGVTSLSLYNNIIMSIEVQDEPTEWGENNHGKYFVKPSTSSVDNVMFAIGWSVWIPMSFWLEGTPTLYSAVSFYLNTEYTLKDAYPLWSAISVLLKEVDSNVVFADSSQCSKFFTQSIRGEQAVMRTPRLDGRVVYLTPITNVKKTRYEQAAQRGDITLKQILDMLRNVYQCYWYIDDSNRLVIEHINYFKHGRKYALGTSYPDIDVSAMKDMPNGLSWDFGTNEAEFDRNRCPSRYEFEWGDECTAEFNGEAIDIQDKHASGDKKEKVKVTNFTADIDYTVINPSGVSDDIYALIEASTSGIVQTPSVRLSDQSPIYAMQNGYLSYLYIERYYWTYDLGGWKAKAGDATLDVKDVRRFAKQSVPIPLEGSGVSPFNILIAKTGLGVGDVSEMEVNADTMLAKTKIFLENDMDYSLFLDVEKDPYSHSSSAWFLYNESNFNLVVRWMHPNTGAISTERIDAYSSAVTTHGQTPPKPIVLSVDLDADRLTLVREPNLAYGGYMNYDIETNLEIGADQYSIEFDGNHQTSYDWGYAQFRTGSKSALVHIVASTEQTHDKGYVALRPLPVSTDIYDATALAYASGTETKEYTIPPHTTFFVGYSKDYSVYGNNDTVQINITEIS